MPQSLQVPQEHPGFLIHDIVRLFRLCFASRITDLQLSEAQWRALGTVGKNPHINQTELADYLGIGKAPLGSLVDKLEQAGWLERSADTADRRIKRLTLTRQAQPLANTMRERYSLLESEFLDGISATRRTALAKYLKVIYRNLSGPVVDDLNLMHLVTHVTRLFARHFDQALRELGFTRSQWLVLAALYPQQGISQNALALSLQMQKAPLGALVDELERGGWVERRTDPEDRRVRHLFLSAACTRQWAALNESYEHIHKQSIAGVPDDQREQLRQSLYRIRDNLQVIAGESRT